MPLETILQCALAAVLALFVCIWASLRHAEYIPPDGVLQMVLLVDFFEQNFPKLFEGQVFHAASAVEKPEIRSKQRVKYFLHLYRRYQAESRITPSDINQNASTDLDGCSSVIAFIMMACLLLVFSPFVCVMFWRECSEKEDGRSCSPIVHSHERSLIAMQVIGLILSVVVLFGVACVYFDGLLLGILFVLLCIPLACLLASLGILTINQNRWKSYWLERLQLSLQSATRVNDHDLYNRALNLFNLIDRQPLLPITGLQKLVLACFAAAQVLIPPVVQWLQSMESTSQ